MRTAVDHSSDNRIPLPSALARFPGLS
ncbi:hypothetical protein CGRA01v4_06876 [Colletotrichum graminicola]|nr:hypothetical protein CGRA01v4_06876 [Colletotrichum graminicola]